MTLTEGQKTFTIDELPRHINTLTALREEQSKINRKIDEAFKKIYQFTQSVDSVGDADVSALRIYKSVQTDGGTATADDNADTLIVSGGEGIDTSASGDTVTITGKDATTTNKGIASFNTNHFSVTAGAVSLGTDTIDTTLIDWGTGTNQVSADDVPDGSTNAIVTLTQETNWDTHLTSTGTDHTYINQNVTTAGTPTFAGLAVTGTTFLQGGLQMGHTAISEVLSLLMDDGGTIGQTAGPLLTFDDTNDYLEITGCKVGIGTATPLSELHVEGDATPEIRIRGNGANSEPALKFDEGVDGSGWSIREYGPHNSLIFKDHDGTDNIFVLKSGAPASSLLLEATGNFKVGTTLELSAGTTVNEFSTDGTLAGDSDNAVPTEKAVKAYADGLASNPTGVVMAWGGSVASPPSGWLVCDGSAVSRTTYSALFAVIGETFGVGDGSTTFNLPDFTDSFLLHADADSGGTNDVGDTGGASTHTLTTNEIPAHTHTLPSQQTYAAGAYAAMSYAGTGGTSGSTGGGAAHTNRDKYLAMAYIIKT